MIILVNFLGVKKTGKKNYNFLNIKNILKCLLYSVLNLIGKILRQLQAQLAQIQVPI